MTGLVRAEWTKLFSTRVWIGLLAGSVVLVGGLAALITGFAGVRQNGGTSPGVATAEYQQTVFSLGTAAVALLLILGAIGMTQEYRHRTATPTFLTTPQRWRVVVAKILAYALAAVLFAVVILGVLVLVVEVFAGARGHAPSLTGTNGRILLYDGIALVIYTVIGVGLGALLRNQVGSIVAALVYLYVAEPIILAVPALRSAHRWLPGGALQAMTAAPGTPDLLAPWQGALILLGYGLLAAGIGALLTVRRDIT